MAEGENIDSVLAAREFLKISLENSRAVASAVDRIGPRLEKINQRLPSLEAVVRPAYTQICRLTAFSDQIDRSIGPAAAVLKVFGSVCELEKSLMSDHCSDLLAYVSLVKQLEEVLKFLADSCSLAIQWLQDIPEDNNSIADDRYTTNVEKSLRILQDLQGARVRASLSGGPLSVAFDKLEAEFEQLLTDEPLLSLTSSSELARAVPVLSVPILQKLQAIIDRLSANNRLKNCVSVYVEVRISNARRSLLAFDLDYFEKSMAEFDDARDVEGFIDKWSRCLELAVKHVFELESRLCKEVFEKAGSDISSGCLAKIAARSGIVSLLRFGRSFTESKKDPIKLLKLLDIFAVLDNLRVEFNGLFGGEACAEIQTLTRDLIKRVINGVGEIFWELTLQVERQRRISPPPDGSVPRLVSFVTDYCNQLLGSYRPVLTQVLEIHQAWKQENCPEELVNDQVYNILKEMALNLDAWSKAYHDVTLSYFFMMNNHSHLHSLRGTELGYMMGDAWLRAHEQYKDYYAALYLRESWGKLPAVLSQKDPVEAVDDWAKKRLKAFNEAFDDIYKKQSNWVVSDEILREKISQLVVKAFVPTYRRFLQNYGVVVQKDAGNSKYLKYSEQSLENMLRTLFQPKLIKHASTNHLHLIGKMENVATNHFHLTLTAT